MGHGLLCITAQLILSWTVSGGRALDSGQGKSGRVARHVIQQPDNSPDPQSCLRLATGKASSANVENFPSERIYPVYKTILRRRKEMELVKGRTLESHLKYRNKTRTTNLSNVHSNQRGRDYTVCDVLREITLQGGACQATAKLKVGPTGRNRHHAVKIARGDNSRCRLNADGLMRRYLLVCLLRSNRISIASDEITSTPDSTHRSTYRAWLLCVLQTD